MVMPEEKQAIVFVREEISELILLVATDKGAFLYYSDGDRRHWDVNGPHFLGSTIHHRFFRSCSGCRIPAVPQ